MRFIFVYRVMECFNFFDLHEALQLSQHHLMKRLSFLHCIIYSCLLCWKLIDRLCVALFLGYLFHWFIRLFLCQYHACLVTVALLHHLKSRSVMPPAVFFFLSIALVILGLLWFHIHFRIIFSSSVKNVMGNLIGITINL